MKALSLLPYRTWQAWTLSCNPLTWSMRREVAKTPDTFDLVHATAFPYAWPILCARRLARRLDVPFLLTPFLHLGDMQDPEDSIRRAFTQPALMELAKSADVLLLQTEGERQFFWERGFASDRLTLQGMGVDSCECTGGAREAGRLRWGIGPEEIVVGHLANKSVEKGTIDLVQAAQEAWARGARFRVLLAGPEMPNFKQYWDSLPGQPHVIRLDAISESEKRDFFASIDLFALPSRVDSFGLVLLEAWANSVPVVAYRAGGVPWVIHHESDGYVVPCGNVEALGNALQKLSEDHELRQSMGQTGYRRALREFRWSDKLEQVEELYLRSSRINT